MSTKKLRPDKASRPSHCIIRGCPDEPVCLDTNHDTLRRDDIQALGQFNSWVLTQAERELEDGGVPEIWYCSNHAAVYLFPIIEDRCGYTTKNILWDFKSENMM